MVPTNCPNHGDVLRRTEAAEENATQAVQRVAVCETRIEVNTGRLDVAEKHIGNLYEKCSEFSTKGAGIEAKLTLVLQVGMAAVLGLLAWYMNSIHATIAAVAKAAKP